MTDQSLVLINKPLDPDTATLLESEMLAIKERLGSAHSFRAYQFEWRRFTEWLQDKGLTPQSANTVDVQRFVMSLKDRKLSKSTRARAITVIRIFYGALVRAGVLKDNPAREIVNPKVSQDPKTPWLPEETMRRMLAANSSGTYIDERDKLVVLTCFGTGLRRSEVAKIKIEDIIQGPEGQPLLKVIVKGSKSGHVPIAGFLFKALSDWIQRQEITSGYLFRPIPRKNAPIAVGTVRNAVKRTAEKVGLDPTQVTTHAFRRSFITLADSRGMSVRDIQQSVLHQHVETTERYVKLNHAAKNAPAELFSDLLAPKK